MGPELWKYKFIGKENKTLGVISAMVDDIFIVSRVIPSQRGILAGKFQYNSHT
jgi:hypothetical protein